MKSVGIIGAGAAGLSAARHALRAGLRPLVWEKTTGLGGTWQFSPRTGNDAHGLSIHSSMYKNLRTNLPKEVMGFPDFPFPSVGDSFIHHSAVVSYLHSYARHFHITPYIKYEQHVEQVEPVGAEADGGWAVRVRHLPSGDLTTAHCHALFICNGHYSVPREPRVPGLQQYRGQRLHSHDYREPAPFAGATVLVLGAGASGIDISLELTTVAKEVILSHDKQQSIESALPANMRQVAAVTAAREDGFMLADGSKVRADVILFCTGYEFTFPFLSEACGVRVENNSVRPLYLHLINALHPTMALVGIPLQVCPFPTFDVQARFFTKVLTGEVQLPSKEDMLAAIEEEALRQSCEGKPTKHFHLMLHTQWDYMEQLCTLAGEQMVQPVIKTLFNSVRALRNKSLLTYKDTNYRITGPDTYDTL